MFKALESDNRFLVARCLVALEAMKSPKLAALPAGLLERNDLIKVIQGSFAFDYTLARLAREIAAKCEPQHGADPSQPFRSP
jgi:hypothetical protein